MSFHPPIKTFTEHKNRLCDCCKPPACLNPEVEWEEAYVPFCFYTEYDGLYHEFEEGQVAPCLPFYKKRTVTQQRSGAYSIQANEDNPALYTYTYSVDYNIGITEEYVNVISCDLQSECAEFSGDCSEYLYGIGEYARDEYGQITGWANGPFISYSKEASLENMAGMPDPWWTPEEGETEEDRPLLPEPCYLVWRGTHKVYSPIEEEIADPETGVITRTVIASGLASTTEILVYAGSPFNDILVPVNTSYIDPAVITKEYELPIECNEWREEAIASGDILEWQIIGGPSAFLYCGCIKQYPQNQDNTQPDAKALRYRIEIPPCHPGSWFRLEWDEVFFPEAYVKWFNDASIPNIELFDPNANPPPALPTITRKSWEWTGNALGDCDNSVPLNSYDFRKTIAARMSPWSSVILPPENGIIELSNYEMYCYRNDYGTKPQKTNPTGFVLPTYDENDVDRDGIPDSDEPIDPPTEEPPE